MTRYAVINTRHRADSGRLAVAIDGGDQDADTTPEPPPVAPAALLIAVLRSVGDHRRPVLPHEGRPPSKGATPTHLRITARGRDFYLATSGDFYLAIDRW